MYHCTVGVEAEPDTDTDNWCAYYDFEEYLHLKPKNQILFNYSTNVWMLIYF